MVQIESLSAQSDTLANRDAAGRTGMVITAANQSLGLYCYDAICSAKRQAVAVVLKWLKPGHTCFSSADEPFLMLAATTHVPVWIEHNMNERFRVMQRQPRRISITLSYHVHEALLSRSEEEGRSVSNLCAFLLEDALREPVRQFVVSGPAANSMLSAGNGNKHIRPMRNGNF